MIWLFSDRFLAREPFRNLLENHNIVLIWTQCGKIEKGHCIKRSKSTTVIMEPIGSNCMTGDTTGHIAIPDERSVDVTYAVSGLHSQPAILSIQ